MSGGGPAHLTIIGAGFLGTAVAVETERRGKRVTIIGRSDPYSLGDRESATLRYIRGEGAEHLPKLLREGTEAVIIAAGGRFPVASSEQPAADAMGTLSLLIPICEAVRGASPATRIVFLSSAGGVYAPAKHPKRESDPGEPSSPYGMSRLVSEQYLGYYRRMHGLLTHSLRCANVYGRLLPRLRGQGVVSAAFWSALTGEPFNLSGDGSQTRDFLHVEDFAHATVDLLFYDRDLPEIVNVGSGIPYSISDVLQKVSATTGNHITVAPKPERPTDTGNLTTDISLLRTIIDFEPRHPDTGIELMAADIATGKFGPPGAPLRSS